MSKIIDYTTETVTYYMFTGFSDHCWLFWLAFHFAKIVDIGQLHLAKLEVKRHVRL